MTLLSKMGLGPKGLAAVGLESDQAVVGTGTTVAMLTAGLSISESNLELASINDTISNADALGRIGSRLEGIIARVSNVSLDGMTQREATLVTASIDEINDELGADLISMPSNESFGDKISAKNFTELGLEAADSGLKKVWEFILATAKKIKDMFATWWEKFFGSVEKLKAYAAKVKKANESYSDDRENKKIDVKGKLLFKGTTKPANGAIATGLVDLEKTVGTFLDKHVTQTEGTTDAVTTAIEGMDGVTATHKTKVNALVADAQVKAYLAGTDAVATGSVMGGKFIDVENSQSNVTGLEAEGDSETPKATVKGIFDTIAKVNYRVKAEEGSTVGGSKTLTIDRLTKAQVETVCDAAIEIADGILALRKSRTDARKYADDVEKAVAQIKKDSEGLDDANKANKSDMVAAAKCGLSVLKATSGGAVSSWTAHLVNVSNEALKAANASL